MSSRMSKYYEEETLEKKNYSRVNRHEELYKEISKNELDNYDIKSNATILGDNHNEIDVEKIKKILDTKYNSVPQRKSIRLEEEEYPVEEKEDTKEYDINVILEKAHEQKEENYEEERLKKLRNTQFDILSNLNIDKENRELEAEKDLDEDDLKTLISKISYNENRNNEEDIEKEISTSLEILSELKGSENTEVLNGLKDEVSKNLEAREKEKIMDTKMIDSFYTSSNKLKTKDFEDVDDFARDIESNNKFLKILIIIIVIVFLVGIGLLIKTVLFS